ncbi:MAG: hypothetical protein JJU28_14525 [Cyclobacteriaceae bacterium]|nr:hypothetical protein [Cyclobacteriaceae bacterium]
MLYSTTYQDLCNHLNTEISLFRDEKISLDLVHQLQDPEGINRITLQFGDFILELLPSKGLAPGRLVYKDQDIFWDPPSPLYRPEEINPLSDEICIQGKPQKGLIYIKTFTAGIELLGLQNWGMHYTDAKGHFHPLHGEVSHIPTSEIRLTKGTDFVLLEGIFDYRKYTASIQKPWYKQGEPLFNITRQYKLFTDGRLLYKDIIENISNQPHFVDWGYHVTFRGVDEAYVIIHGSEFIPRGGGKATIRDIIWQSAKNEDTRIETGIIFKELRPVYIDSLGRDMVQVQFVYPDARAFRLFVPPSPYFQTWFCAGGEKTDEFTYKNGEPVLKKSWNGMGIEFGASALDHDGNTDPDVPVSAPLQPGEKVEIPIYFLF